MVKLQLKLDYRVFIAYHLLFCMLITY